MRFTPSFSVQAPDEGAAGPVARNPLNRSATALREFEDRMNSGFLFAS